MMIRMRVVQQVTLALVACWGSSSMYADMVTTTTGTLAADNSDYATILNIPTTEVLTAYTTSYAGGMNLDGTTSMGGGFVPELTLFSGSSGNAVATSRAGCGGMGAQDAGTTLCNDAFLQTTLMAGTYWLYLTEFPNTVDPSNQTTPTFLFSSDPTATGDACGVAGGMFLEADLATCVQRTNQYSLNISTAAASAVPEPASVGIAATGLLIAGLIRRRSGRKS
jgi:hypothetical protein